MRTLSTLAGILGLLLALLHLIGVGMNIFSFIEMMSMQGWPILVRIAFYGVLNLFLSLFFLIAGLFFLNMTKRL